MIQSPGFNFSQSLLLPSVSSIITQEPSNYPTDKARTIPPSLKPTFSLVNEIEYLIDLKRSNINSAILQENSYCYDDSEFITSLYNMKLTCRTLKNQSSFMQSIICDYKEIRNSCKKSCLVCDIGNKIQYFRKKRTFPNFFEISKALTRPSETHTSIPSLSERKTSRKNYIAK